MDRENPKIILDNFRAYIQMYQDWGLEGVNLHSSLETPARKASEGESPPQAGHPASPVKARIGVGPSERGVWRHRRSEAPHGPPLNMETTKAPTNKPGLLAALRDEIGECTRCKLQKGRTHLVFGTGDPQAELMFVGEAPGEDEDRVGQPFVGKAGQLLTRIIRAMGLPRDKVYIANIIKCRPPKNRNPDPDEIETCSPFLRRQIEIIRPKVICALGTFAAQTLLATGQKISQLRGRFHALPVSYSGGAPSDIKVMPTYHPAYLLRNPQDKKRVWDDMQLIMRELTTAGGSPR